MQRTIAVNQSRLDLRMVIETVRERMMKEKANLKTARRSFENELIAIVMEKVNGNRKRAARILGVSQSRISQSRYG